MHCDMIRDNKIQSNDKVGTHMIKLGFLHQLQFKTILFLKMFLLLFVSLIVSLKVMNRSF